MKDHCGRCLGSGDGCGSAWVVSLLSQTDRVTSMATVSQRGEKDALNYRTERRGEERGGKCYCCYHSSKHTERVHILCIIYVNSCIQDYIILWWSDYAVVVLVVLREIINLPANHPTPYPSFPITCSFAFRTIPGKPVPFSFPVFIKNGTMTADGERDSCRCVDECPFFLAFVGVFT